MLYDNFSNNGLDGILCRQNMPLGSYTTYGLGGKVKRIYFPKTEEEAAAVFKYLNDGGEKFFVLGNGSNVLAADGDIGYTVICTKYLSGIIEKDNSLYCLSGTTVKQLLDFCVQKQIGGFEYLAGIPATVGGLALMNGGIPEKHIAEDIISVSIFDGNFKDLPNEKCKFGNKHSTMCDINAIIVGVNLSKNAVPREAVKENIKKHLLKRRRQPAGKSCGCVFKNPPNQSAGKLIDEAGLKGCKIGGAEVSLKHANFIINRGGTAADVYRLIKLVKRKVFEFCGVLLEEEVIYIGEFNDFDS